MRINSAVADRLTALVLFFLGAAATWGGFVMDRLEIRRIHPASIPGLVPMFLGVALMICALALAWSARAPRAEAKEPGEVSVSGFAVTLIWSALYALIAVGHMPFTLATAIYITGFTFWFLWTGHPEGTRPAIVRMLPVPVFGIATAFGISILFRDGFLVRLP